MVHNSGLTETCGPITLGFPDEMSMVGAVGSVSAYNEIRLEEVPEMSYNPLGNPPCGEVCVRGKSVFTEYHKSPELTREAMKDGWLHTGPTELFLVLKKFSFKYHGILIICFILCHVQGT